MPESVSVALVARGRKRRDPREVLLDLLKQARYDAGLTQTQLAQELGRHQSYVSKYERGEIVALDILDVRVICAALGMSLPTLVRRLERALGS